VVALSVAGRHAYVALDRSRLLIVDLAQPGGPRLLRSIELPAQVLRLAQGAGYLYALQADGGLAVFDVGDPLAPQWLATSDLGLEEWAGTAPEVLIAGRVLWVVTPLGTRGFDLTSPTAPRGLSLPSAERVRRAVAVRGELLLGVDFDEGLWVYERAGGRPEATATLPHDPGHSPTPPVTPSSTPSSTPSTTPSSTPSPTPSTESTPGVEPSPPPTAPPTASRLAPSRIWLPRLQNWRRVAPDP
jgi:hypothetical protein